MSVHKINMFLHIDNHALHTDTHGNAHAQKQVCLIACEDIGVTLLYTQGYVYE